MTDILTFDTLEKITGKIPKASAQEANACSFLLSLNTYGGDLGLNRRHRLSCLLGQVLLESGAFRYDRELWGPTQAQQRYDTRTDLGNTPERDGDGYLLRGRGPIQITGRWNYRAFTAWARGLDHTAPDFEADPDAVLTDPWEGLVALWYWTVRGLNALADLGDVRGITRKVNGGFNHLAERQAWTDRAQLVLLGHAPTDARAFQRSAGLTVDGVIGSKTRAALHQALLTLPPVPTLPKPAPRPNWLRRVLAFLCS
ncbi:peptidoglycan-binding protein [Epibacterium sp. Ofav1-8]|uniref:peptidoglycan-binding protein n=1 Tax=Epibacterium sp. Ofav1-8 TaxID=2917735 RepID=UPI001EF70DC5|nr:peptidoglycan-binding protein [Epibacterium sp. Ofav1-8]MCG7622293.1 peptidoglycan-binding protein [Epibacterium sp. Ofav1-8]